MCENVVGFLINFMGGFLYPPGMDKIWERLGQHGGRAHLPIIGSDSSESHKSNNDPILTCRHAY